MKSQLAVAATSFLLAGPVLADKAGPYVSLGVTSNVYGSVDDDDFDSLFEDERVTGWRLEGGYIWDLGKPGGFHLGVVGAYNDFGKATIEEYYCSVCREELSVQAQALSVLLVIEQEIASWVDFVFKVGPSAVAYDVDWTDYYIGGYYQDSESSTEPGVTAVIGFTFFPTEFLAIELASQGTAFVYDYAYGGDEVYTASSLSLSLQYRF